MRVSLIAAIVALLAMPLAGCARSAPSAAGTASVVAPGVSRPSAPDARTDGPSPAALMVCSDDVGRHIQQALRLPSAPVGDGSWSADRYTCTYDLPMGRLLLAVSEAPDQVATSKLFTDIRQSMVGHDLIGLAEGAYGTDDGVVVVRKDTDVLTVDATRLPARFGPEQSHPAEFAYEIASDVLGCWTGGE